MWAGVTPYSMTPADGTYLLRPSPDVEPSDTSHTSRIEIPLDAELGELDREPALDVGALSGVEGEVRGVVHVDNYTP